jgi:hypothetical protein
LVSVEDRAAKRAHLVFTENRSIFGYLPVYADHSGVAATTSI